MRRSLLSLAAVALLLCGHAERAAAQKILGDGIKDLAAEILAKITKEQKRRVAVLPFREMNGRKSVLDTYLSEALLTELFAAGKFEVVERGMLDRVLAEIKLGQTGIIDPETARRVGKVAGVDAIVTGTITDLKSSIAVNCRLIDAQTGLVFSAAQVRIVKDDDVKVLIEPVPGEATRPDGEDERGNAGGVARGSTTPPRAMRERLPQPPRGTAGGSGDAAMLPQFDTSDYRLVVESVRKAGAETRVVLRLESRSNESVDFAASDWYLVDENGNHWSSSRNVGGFSGSVASEVVFYSRAHLIPETKLRGTLVFHANGSVDGTQFTLIATESVPGRGREIVVRGLTAR